MASLKAACARKNLRTLLWLAASAMLVFGSGVLVTQADNAQSGRSLKSLAIAKPNHWRIASLEGDVRVRDRAENEQPGAWRGPRIGESLEVTTEVETGESGRIWLVRHGDIVGLEASSQAIIPFAKRADAPTTIEQPFGQANYLVETRPDWSFQVKTPYLVAVVKGTGFGVSVGTSQASVSVSEGTVGVSSASTGASSDVSAGQTASVSDDASAGVSVSETAANASTAAASNANANSSGNASGNSNGNGNGNGNGNK